MATQKELLERYSKIVGDLWISRATLDQIDLTRWRFENVLPWNEI